MKLKKSLLCAMNKKKIDKVSINKTCLRELIEFNDSDKIPSVINFHPKHTDPGLRLVMTLVMTETVSIANKCIGSRVFSNDSKDTIRFYSTEEFLKRYSSLSNLSCTMALELTKRGFGVSRHLWNKSDAEIILVYYIPNMINDIIVQHAEFRKCSVPKNKLGVESFSLSLNNEDLTSDDWYVVGFV